MYFNKGLHLFDLLIVAYLIVSGLGILALIYRPQVTYKVLGTNTCDITVTSDAQLTAANTAVLAGQTVCLDNGTYFAPIAPTHSGTSDANRIVYTSVIGATVTLKQLINVANLSYITVSDINIISTTGSKNYIDATGADHIIIDNVDMSSGAALTPGQPPIYFRNTSYSVIRNSHLYGADDHYNDVVTLLNDSHHNLIENNRFDEGSHTNILAQGDGSTNPSNPPRFNIIRNNHFYNTWHHCINMMYGVHDNVFDGNVFEQCGAGVFLDPNDTRTYHDSAGDYGDFHGWEDNSLYRRNVFMNSGDWDSKYNNHAGFLTGVSSSYPVNSLPMLGTVRYNHFYNNVFYGNFGPALKVGIYSRLSPELTGYHDNKFVNNILYNNGTNGTLTKNQVNYQLSDGGAGVPSDPPGEEWRNNIIGDPGDLAFTYRGTNYTITDATLIGKFASFTGNISGNPGFVGASRNGATADFHLASTSIAKDAGDFLTKTTQACSGNTITVQDARYFIDGYGIVAPDQVQIEGGATYTISSIDYNTNIITTTTSTSCLSGKGVSLPYQGSKPDIGVFESSSTAVTPTPTPTPPPSSCIVTGLGFYSHTFANQTNTFTAAFDATPTNDADTGMSDIVIGLGDGPITVYTDFSANIRFNSAGFIDARNGNTYTTSTTPFTSDTQYHFRLVVNVLANTYSAYVTPAGGSEITLGTNLGFRVPAASLNTWATAITSGTVSVCNFAAIGIVPTATPTIVINTPTPTPTIPMPLPLRIKCN